MIVCNKSFKNKPCYLLCNWLPCNKRSKICFVQLIVYRIVLNCWMCADRELHFKPQTEIFMPKTSRFCALNISWYTCNESLFNWITPYGPLDMHVKAYSRWVAHLEANSMLLYQFRTDKPFLSYKEDNNWNKTRL